jgi:hypothetical protein
MFQDKRSLEYPEKTTRLAAASDKVYQLLDHGRWFSPGTPGSSVAMI